MNKSYRQAQILGLIKSQRITTQDRLAHELAGLGIETTQVTLSRDIRELGLVKTAEGYRQVQKAARPVSEFEDAAAEHLRDVRVAQNLLVLKTRPGHAPPLAVALDESDWPEVVGTVAGDDTILVIAPDKETAAALKERMLEFLK
jgi:transcriptional regulator of arginine metabolism